MDADDKQHYGIIGVIAAVHFLQTHDMILLVLLTLCGLGDALNVFQYDIALPSDPYLQFRPPFVRSLPVQILLTGIVLTLVVVLLIHLILTAQYHWPLAPVNYVLQLSGVITLSISLIATIHVILSTAATESQQWPYMLSYIAVNVPPLRTQHITSTRWSIAERVTWLIMNASTSALIQITHIHFLTLLYPSRLEGRLIFALLVPLALASAIMQLIPIEGIESRKKTIIASSILHNICNATLSFLFTTALFIWGFLVNRRQAWRTDGGTAIFGTGALSLATISTALNVLYIDRATEYVWLPGLMWAVVLWQSFLGWWWWVGAGSGGGLLSVSESYELEERLKRQEKREIKKRETKERRRNARMRAKKVIKDVTGAFGRRSGNDDDSDSITVVMASSSTTAVDASSSNDVQSDRRRRKRRIEPSADENADVATEVSDAESETQSPPSVTTTISSSYHRIFPRFLLRWCASLRHAHLVAAREQEVERVRRISGLRRQHPIRIGGWGLGSFGWRMAGWNPEDEDNEGVRQPRGENRTTSLKSTSSEETLASRTTSMAADESSKSWGPENGGSSNQPTSTSPTVPPPAHAGSIWWWGPLRQWRLQDTTVY